MKNISIALKNALKKDNIIERDYIIINGTTDKIYLWFNLYDDCYKDGNFVQNFIMKRIEFDYSDSNIDFRQKEFKAYKEFMLQDGTWESIGYGTFIVYDIKESDTKESIKVTAYDYGLKFAKSYKSELNYPSGGITILDVLEECCIKCDVEYEFTEFVNSGFIIDSNQFDGAQFGSVISAIAGISCNFAKIVDDKLKLIFANITDVVIETDDYSEFEDNRDIQPITVVGLGVSNIEGENVTIRWEDGIQDCGENYLMLVDNPFAYTQDKREELITGIYNKAKGFGYSSMTLKNCLYPYLELGDVVTVKNKSGESIQTIILKINIEETEIGFEAPSITKASIEYENPVTALEIAKRTEIIVNKQDQTIQSVASLVEENNTKISKITQNVDNVNLNLQQAGGLNLLQDSTLRLGYDGNIKNGTVSIEQNNEILDNTVSKTAIKVNNGSVKFAPIKIKENTDYTFSCIIYKLELTNVQVKITTGTEKIYNIEIEPGIFTEVEFPVNSAISQVEIEILSDNNYVLFCDCMFNKGGKLGYQSYPGELVGTNYSFGNNGLEVESTIKNTKTIFGAEGTIIKNRETNKVKAEFNGDNSTFDRATFFERLNIGKMRFSVLQDGRVGISYDKDS